ncbi:MAG TPA: dienelactone hydrolase family protein [Geminicoccaceae bacterium]|nr:dienelactone hydrolase family protein [Geminicoccus sp.]HMU48834.1 dienelactone hydrolase family protein [Geminicoccaceae bacterium]
MPQLHGPSVLPGHGTVQRIVVLLHGVGADGRDLIDLVPMLRPALPDTAFHAPDGPEPCDMAPFGRQWFSLQDRRPEAMLAGIRRSAPILDAYLDGLLERHALPPKRLALLGFSQGTMMSLHVAPRRPEAIAGVLGFSGALLGPELLAGEARSRPPVMLVHGDADDIVPVAALGMAVSGLKQAGFDVEGIVRPGLPHSIDPYGIEAGGRFLAKCLGVGPD